MLFKAVVGVSWLALLIFAIRSGGKLAESRQETEELKGRLKSVTEEVATAEASASEQAKIQAELEALKKALTLKNREMEQMHRQSAREREQLLRASSKERETFTAGIANVLSRFEFSQQELETLLADLPAGDRLRLLEQFAVLQASALVGAEEPATTATADTPSADESGNQAIAVSEAEPAVGPGELSSEAEIEGESASDEPVNQEKPKFTTYTVKRGDNLTRIGRKFDVDVAQLMKLNGIANANLLRVDQVLKIPQN